MIDNSKAASDNRGFIPAWLDETVVWDNEK